MLSLRPSLLFTSIAGALFVAGMFGCVPTTPYRYTAMTPAARPVAWDGRPADRGSLRVDGSITHTTVIENWAPVPGDTALHVPRTTIDGSATLSVTHGLEIGARFSYASYDWTTESAAGTQPLTTSPSLFGVGPEVRLAVPLDREHRWKIGFAGNMISYAIPYSSWSLGCGTTKAPCVNGYSLVDQGTENHTAFALGVYPSVSFGPDGRYGALFAFLGGHTGYKNDGFATTASNAGAIEDTGFVMMSGVGYGAKLDLLRLSGMIFAPWTNSNSPVDYGIGSAITVGVDLDLFGDHDEEKY